MKYVCIENNRVISILNYLPAESETIQVAAITDQEYSLLELGTHYYDIPSSYVKLKPTEYLNALEQVKQKQAARNFLNSTDWQVLRHIRQQALGIPTSLSEEKYIELEQARHAAAEKL